MLKKLWGKGNTPTLLLGVQSSTSTLEINVAMFQNIKEQVEVDQWDSMVTRPSK